MNPALGKERIQLTVQLALVHTCLYELLCCKVHMKKVKVFQLFVTSWTAMFLCLWSSPGKDTGVAIVFYRNSFQPRY